MKSPCELPYEPLLQPQLAAGGGPVAQCSPWSKSAPAAGLGAALAVPRRPCSMSSLPELRSASTPTSNSASRGGPRRPCAAGPYADRCGSGAACGSRCLSGALAACITCACVGRRPGSDARMCAAPWCGPCCMPAHARESGLLSSDGCVAPLPAVLPR
eukprot:363171-Chlamydomonas_euryale.AAC.2